DHIFFRTGQSFRELFFCNLSDFWVSTFAMFNKMRDSICALYLFPRDFLDEFHALTDFATAFTTRLSRRSGMILPAVGRGTSAASALAARSFVASVIRVMPLSSAPRNMPGYTSALLSWFGKSERPVAITAAPAFFATSGITSGMGLASAN